MTNRLEIIGFSMQNSQLQQNVSQSDIAAIIACYNHYRP